VRVGFGVSAIMEDSPPGILADHSHRSRAGEGTRAVAIDAKKGAAYGLVVGWTADE